MNVEGTILAGPDFEPIEGQVVVEDGIITAVEETETAAESIVLPAFVNAHTHIGDSIAKEAGAGLSLDELVAPPDGLKHRLLQAADRETKVDAMRGTIRLMEATGTAAFIEFREGGVDGVEMLREAATRSDSEPIVLGRETEAAMRAGDGFGASGARDRDFDQLRNATRRADKMFAIHAGERDATDINAALDLRPEFVVHMVHAEELHLDRLEDMGTPVVVCPRSNLVTDVGFPPIEALFERTTVALGTDNVMTNGPSMFREMEFVSKLTDLSDAEVLAMATKHGAELADRNYGVIEPGREAKLLELDGTSDNLSYVKDPCRAVVRRAGSADIKRVHL